MLALPPSPRMELTSRAASPDLQPFVLAFVERKDLTALQGMRELPVPAPLIQIMLGADVHLTDGTAAATAPRVGLWGPSSTTPWSRTEQPMHAFVAVLTLRGAAVLARAAEGPIADRRMDLDALLDPEARRGLSRIVEAPTATDRIAAAEAWLRVLMGRAGKPNPAEALMDAMLQHRIRGPVAGIAGGCGISERALHKRCHRLIGWSPKRVLRIARLQRLLRTLHPSPWLSAGDEDDARLEYADDSHLARDLMDLTGLTISAYRASKIASRDRLVHTLI
ncbi:AraC family transcriptional regulator [Brevundimonas sp.]|uniref:helix-turn-helix domain-containing protein n=1 Tax=Brevundimonas sp. TaxID=1871086 RepID=UPI0025BF73E1|nr:helix-turn-helix domain-containing protein [Brevundimonas sp.]